MTSIPLEVKQERIALRIEWRRQVEESMFDPSVEAQQRLDSLFVTAPENPANKSRVPNVKEDMNFDSNGFHDGNDSVEIKSILRSRVPMTPPMPPSPPGMKPPPWNAVKSDPFTLPRVVATPLRNDMRRCPSPPRHHHVCAAGHNHGRSLSPVRDGRRPGIVKFSKDVTVAYHIPVGKQNPTPPRDSIHAAAQAGMDPFKDLPDEYMQKFRS